MNVFVKLTMACCAVFGGVPLAAAQSMEKPNIVIILADDLGWGDVGYNGGDIKTPCIDRLAKDGVVLNYFYTAPICSPTRAGLLTGRYPNRFGLRQTVIPPWSEFGVDTTEVFLSDMLAEAGYVHRAAFGKWHLGHSKRAYLPLQRGFTRFYGHYNGAIDYFTHMREGELDWHRNEETCYDEGYATDLITKEAVESIRQYAKESSPFFIYVAYNAPHSPLQAKEDDLRLYGYENDKPLYGSGKQELAGRGNTKRQTYLAMVAAMDRGIGEILSALKEAGISEQTLVLFFSDNGAAPGYGGSSGELRGAKFTEWEGGVRAPAIVKWPAGFAGGRISNQVTGYIDVVPTIRDVLGLSTDLIKPLDGISIWPVLSGSRATIPREFYLGYGTLITENRWKLVKAGSGNSRMEIQEDMLFDIQMDPYEKKDLKTQFPSVYRQMLRQVTQVYDAIPSQVSVPSYETGRENFKAPKDWKVLDRKTIE